MAVRLYLILLFSFTLFSSANGQMLHGPDTLVGNEWIRYGQAYYKFSVDADGVYRIPYATLESAGLAGEAVGMNIRLYNMGRQVPLYVSTDGNFGTNDFIEFYGYKNRGEMDRNLFLRPDEDMLNPGHSMYTDLRFYYLTIEEDGIPSRVNNLSNNITNPPAPEPYYWHKEVITYNAAINDPYFSVSGGGAVSYSSYFHTEGFSKTNETNSATQINAPGRLTSGPDATLRIRLASTNYGNHRMVAMWNGEVLDTIFESSETFLHIKDITYNIPLASVLDINQLTLTAINAQSRHTLVTIELLYPHTTTLSGTSDAQLCLKSQTGDQYHILDGFPHNGTAPLIYSLDGLNRMITDINGSSQVQFLWPNGLEATGLHLMDQATFIRTISALEEKVFTDFSEDNTEYIVITHPALMEIGTGSEYIQYRTSTAGGSYNAKAYSILDLYDQFGYGIIKHPQAIRNFVTFFQRQWPSAKMIFIVGRGIEYNRSRYDGTGWEPGFFVPTFGRPGADNLLAATLWDLVPRYPIGRLAVFNAQGVSDYLSKVKEHDLARFSGQTLGEKTWIKNVMHLSGGKTASEQNDFKNTLQSLGNDLAASDYGANVSFFQKESTDIIGETQAAQVLQLLHEGCGIINYLGHSASSTLEFQINDPNEWNNRGRYPIFSAMGCSAGQIHGNILSLSDNYVQLPNEGAIAFISGSGSQFPNALVSWARPWYGYFGNLNYGTTLGESIRVALKAISNFVDPKLTGSNSYRYLLEQQTFQGDPALQLHPFPGPDYVVDRSSVTISPEVLSTKLDSFDLGFVISNIGRNLRQNVNYTITILLPDGRHIELKNGTALAGTFESAVVNRLPLMTEGKAGAFRLLIRLDPANALEELPAPEAEANNVLVDNFGVEGIEFLVVDNLISAVYPPDFSIVTTAVPELVATGSNSFSKRQAIAFQIDTTALFNSTFLVKETFPDHASTLKWSPQVNWVPDQVYYWRVSTDSISPEQGFLWSRRSFIYKPGTSRGWNQSHFHQLADNGLTQLLADSTKYTFPFGSKARNFKILNRYHNVAQGIIPQVVENGVILAEFFTGFRERNVQVFVVAIDSLTGEYMRNPNPGLYGSSNHLSFAAKCFPYRTDLPESRQALIHFIEDIIPAGHYVFLYTYQRQSYPDYFPEQWEADEATFGKSIFSMIEEQFPSSAIRTLASTGSKPYIVFFQKDRGGIQELIAVDTADVISMSLDIKGSLTKGSRISKLIGPASQWHSILWDAEEPTSDTSGVNMLSAYALSPDLSDTFHISSQLISKDTIIEGLDAAAYPFIQLVYSTQDSVSYNPSDIIFWRVLYEGYPEFVINPDIGFEFVADTLNQGETMRLSTYIENVSPYDVDSLPVSLRIISGNNTTEQLTDVITDFKGHTFVPIEFQKSTEQMSGDYQVVMEVNPGRTTKELNYNNNIGILPMRVEGDRANPILDVTFDGYHILDGDLVASNPLILIQLHDENEFLRLDDTSSFELYLQFPSENDLQRISFSEEWVKFVQSPAEGKNVAAVELTPDLYEDGIYVLQVRAKDASGNIAGDNDYLISFEVIHAESVSHIYNYPNPFRHSTRFIYTLTGRGSPAYYKIEIVSITGTLVREITQDELGPLAVGTHMTDFVWDGSNQNGAPLPSGIYLYRMIVKDENQKEYDRYGLPGEYAFVNKGWGKLVIIR